MDERLALAGAGVLCVVALLAALFLTGGDADEGPLAYDVHWVVEPGPVTTRADHLEEGRNDSHEFALVPANVTNVTVWLNWTDDVGEPDEFRLQVEPPNASAREATSHNESIRLSFPLAEIPELGTVEAGNRSQAREEVDRAATEGGQAAWQIRVSLEEAPGRRPVPDADIETEPDGANGYNLTFTYRSYHADLGEPRPPEPDG